MPEMDYKAIALYLHIFEIISIGLIGFYSWMVSRHKANENAIDNLGKSVRQEINELDDRIIRVEEGVKNLPTHKDTESLNRRIDDVAQEVRKLEGTLVSVNNGVQMIHQHLLSSQGKS
jgi:predicted  nucleic acid-binding Zn-ribbon protein